MHCQVMHEYTPTLPALEAAVAACPPVAGHSQLAKAVAGIPGLENAAVRTTRGGDGGTYLSRRKVLRADGSIVHDDHAVFLAEQLEADNGNAKATKDRLVKEGYLLSRCDITNLYLASDRGDADPADFVQIEVDLHDERVNCELFGYFFDHPQTLRDLIERAEGDLVSEDRRTSLGAPHYELRRVTDVAVFVDLAEQLEAQQRNALRNRQYTVTASGTTTVKTHADIDPHFDRFPSKTKRLFDDWQHSSAGRSGERFSAHWLLKFSDWTDPKTGTRYLSVVPLWTFAKKLAEVKSSTGDVYGLFSKLQTLDRRVQVPFAWYFYMLHGNRVHDGAGKRVLEAAESGLIVLPEHDYRVLRAWRDRNYGF